MKRLIRFLSAVSAVILLAGGFVLPARAKADAALFGVVTGNASVNLRQNHTTAAQRIGSYAPNTWVQITSSVTGWYEVKTPNGKSGWMNSKYVKIPGVTYTDVGYVKNPKASSFLNLRSSASYSSAVTGIYYNGTPFLPLDYSGGWYHVRVTDGKEGYFRAEYVTMSTGVAYANKAATVVTPNGTALNLRSGPGYGYAVIGQLFGGDYAMVLQKGTDWWLVSAGGQIGYMNAAYLKDGLLSPSAAGNTGGGTPSGAKESYAVVSNPGTRQVLNVREMPSATAKAVGHFGNGTKLKVLSQGAEWCRVKAYQGDVTGWVMTDYLKLTNLSDTPTRTVKHPQKSYVNLRASASMSSRVLAKIAHGAQVIVMIPGASWTKVRVGGYTGYMMTVFLK